LENLEELDIFLGAFGKPKLNQVDTSHLNRSITSNGIEAVISNIPTKKSPGPDAFSDKFYQTFKES
jgi:hypothetical protein